ncbi:MAG: Unknown protein [uncultured Sulfurovum sp.]|uniref:Uncharacterized protein n=1 Tax=uncultured Sulfurovum sp. TaxID=269237 RepID=A0A6S6UEF7_9BACT|nr:MAG: Unknown protein [uncultured Sulfurovum sp.]
MNKSDRSSTAGAVERVNTLTIYEKYNFFKTHIGMFIAEPTYIETVALLKGMNYASNNNFLGNFNKWVNYKFNINTPFEWSVLIKYIYTGEINSIFNLEVQYINKNTSDILFLFDLIDEFLESSFSQSKMSCPTISDHNPIKK